MGSRKGRQEDRQARREAGREGGKLLRCTCWNVYPQCSSVEGRNLESDGLGLLAVTRLGSFGVAAGLLPFISQYPYSGPYDTFPPVITQQRGSVQA